MSTESSVAERLAEIRQRIDDACSRCSRNAEDVTLVGVGKRQPLERIRAAIAAGLSVLGENRMQEAVVKIGKLQSSVDWHFIGPLQSNKVRLAVQHFSTVHSIDRVKIARRLEHQAALQERRIHGLIQVNVGSEPTKHGFEPAGLAQAVRPLADLDHLRIAGLMTIPPYEDNPEDARHWFRKLRELRDELCSRSEWEGCPGFLSMGMSHDFEIAIEEGATHVRVGTALFGPRPTA